MKMRIILQPALLAISRQTVSPAVWEEHAAPCLTVKYSQKGQQIHWTHTFYHTFKTRSLPETTKLGIHVLQAAHIESQSVTNVKDKGFISLYINQSEHYVILVQLLRTEDLCWRHSSVKNTRGDAERAASLLHNVCITSGLQPPLHTEGALTMAETTK